MNESRCLFERQQCATQLEPNLAHCCDRPQEYEDLETQAMFDVWKAARASALHPDHDFEALARFVEMSFTEGGRQMRHVGFVLPALPGAFSSPKQRFIAALEAACQQASSQANEGAKCFRLYARYPDMKGDIHEVIRNHRAPA